MKTLLVMFGVIIAVVALMIWSGQQHAQETERERIAEEQYRAETRKAELDSNPALKRAVMQEQAQRLLDAEKTLNKQNQEKAKAYLDK